MTSNQQLAIVGVVLSALMTATAFLTDTFGATVAKEIVGSAGFLNMILQGIVAIMNGQASQIAAVQSMPGVSKIVVNSQANQTLASMAVSEVNTKVEAEKGSEQRVAAIAATGN